MTRAAAIREAAVCLAAARARRDELPVQEAAEAAYTPGGPSLAELVERIHVARGYTTHKETHRDENHRRGRRSAA